MKSIEPPPALRPGQLARLASVSTDTLRHYERKGLLQCRRSPNGYREYPREALDRVRLVQRALSVGFSLDELGRVFEIRDRGGAPCREVQALAAEKLESMEEQIRDLIELRDQLRALIEEWDARLASTPKGRRAHLLDTWSNSAIELPAGRHRPAGKLGQTGTRSRAVPGSSSTGRRKSPRARRS